MYLKRNTFQINLYYTLTNILILHLYCWLHTRKKE